MPTKSQKLAATASFIISLPVVIGLIVLIRSMREHFRKIREGYRWE